MITGTARALATVGYAGGRPDWKAIEALLGEWRPDALVVGVPRHLDGTHQPMTDAAERFCRQLEGRFGLTVYRADERLTSAAAAELDDGGQSLDARAARVILESWMSTGPEQP